VLALLLLALVTGSLVYCVLTIIAAVRYRAVRPPALRTATPISILKPLAGVDDGLEDNPPQLLRAGLPRVRNPLRGAQPRRPRHRRGRAPEIRLPLSARAASRKDKDLTITLVNPKPDATLNVNCSLAGGSATGATARILHDADLKAANTFATPDRVVPQALKIAGEAVHKAQFTIPV